MKTEFETALPPIKYHHFDLEVFSNGVVTGYDNLLMFLDQK